MHVDPKSLQNLETFTRLGNASTVGASLSMAVHQGTTSDCERSQGPRRVVSTNTAPGAVVNEADNAELQRQLHALEVEMATQSMRGDSWNPQASSLPVQQHLGQQMQLPEAALQQAEAERSTVAQAAHACAQQQQQQQQYMAQFWQQMLQGMSAPAQQQHLGAGLSGAAGDAAGGDLLQKTFKEIARRCAAGEAGQAGGGSQGLQQDPSTAAMHAGGHWGWGSSSPAAVTPETGDSSGAQQRIEELSQYIKQQAQEYLEGQAEWSRQIAEVRSECLRELEKVRRDKEEVERQARTEFVRLRTRMKEHGVVEEAPPAPRDPAGDGSPKASVAGGASWAACVSMDEFQLVQKKCTSAEERVAQLEQYIKDQNTRQDPESKMREHSDEILRLRQAVLMGSAELHRTNAELQALKQQYQHRTRLWEQAAQRLLSSAEQCLTLRHDGERVEKGHFGKTATKISLELSGCKEGGDVGSLRRLLVDALKPTANGKVPKKDSKEAPPAAAPQTAKDDIAAAPEDQTTQSNSPSKPQSSGLDTPPLAAHHSTALSDSNVSSRDTSPGRSPVAGRNGEVVCAEKLETSAARALSVMAGEFQKLLSLGDLPTGSSRSFAATPDGSPRTQGSGREKSPPGDAASFSQSQGVSTPTPAALAAAAASQEARAKQQQLLDGITPTRKTIAQHVIVVEKMLRTLERDLRHNCEEVFGHAELEVESFVCSITESSITTGLEETARATAIEHEARGLVPLGEESQLTSVTSLRRAQHQSSALLTQFVELPHKLKAIFDLTKKLASEVGSSVPAALLAEAEAKLTNVQESQQRQTLEHDLLQKRLQAMSHRIPGENLIQLQDELAAANAHEEAEDLEAARRELQEEQRLSGCGSASSLEHSLLTARAHVRRQQRALSCQGDRLQSMEQEVVELHVHRHTERAQCMAMLQQSAVASAAAAAVASTAHSAGGNTSSSLQRPPASGILPLGWPLPPADLLSSLPNAQAPPPVPAVSAAQWQQLSQAWGLGAGALQSLPPAAASADDNDLPSSTGTQSPSSP